MNDVVKYLKSLIYILIPILVLNTIGGYLEDFLIDGIDIEFCYRARKFGFNTYTVSGCYLKQRYGTPMVKRFLWKKYILSNYSPFRLYGILKNFKIISQLYPNEKGVRRELKKVYLYQFVRNILFYEDNKKALDFATAASAYKHTLKGDFNWATVEEVEALMSGNISGRVKR